MSQEIALNPNEGSWVMSDFLRMDIKGSRPLIEGLLWQEDTCLLLGKEKVGKSIFSLQLAMSLTTGNPFLGEYDIPEPCNVVYIQGEGKKGETQSHIKKINKAVHAYTNKMMICYRPSLSLDEDECMQMIWKDINDWQKPDDSDLVIIIDCLYSFMSGDMMDAKDARKFTQNCMKLKNYFGATLVINHHAHRSKRNKEGNFIDEGDDSIFGSFVWKAFPDTILLLEKTRDKSRKLSCTTQRSAKVIEEANLLLIDPDPLYFMMKDGTSTASYEKVINALEENKEMTMKEITDKTGYAYKTVWYAVNTGIGKNKISYIDEHPKKFSLIPDDIKA